MVKNKQFETIITKNFMLAFGEDWLISSFNPKYYFKFDEKEMSNFLKTYKYYNIKNKKIEYFEAYNLLNHLRYGLNFNLDKEQKIKQGWPSPPIDKITFKISEDKTKILGFCQNVNSSYIHNLYSWANKFLIIDSFNLRLITSSTGWLEIYRKVMEGLTNFKQQSIDQTLRGAFATYYLNRPDDLFFSHEDNFKTFSRRAKDLVYFVVTKTGYLTINYRPAKHFYVGQEMHDNFNRNFLSKCSRPTGPISNRNISIYSQKTGLVIPYKYLYRYTLTGTFPSDNFWFDSRTFKSYPDYTLLMKFELTDEKYVLLDKQNDLVITTSQKMPSKFFRYDLTTANLNSIKKYNSYSNELKDFNLETLKTAHEHSYFLYDNNSLIRESFVTELNKKIYLIGSITFYEEVNETGKSFLVTSRTKLKFNVKENNVAENFNFNLSHTNASGKILLKKDEIHNLMIIATEKLTRVGQKRKMFELIDTVIVKALQSYDKYSTLNPLEIDLNSNYLSKIIHDYKGFTFEVRLINVLFSASLEDEMQNIFIVCHNLSSAKKALINKKIYSLLGIINLNEIKQWNEMKGKSLYVNAKIDDSHYMENAKHFGFKFKSSFPTEFLEFTCEFLDDKAEKIKFEGGDKKFPIIDFQIDILK